MQTRIKTSMTANKIIDIIGWIQTYLIWLICTLLHIFDFCCGLRRDMAISCNRHCMSKETR